MKRLGYSVLFGCFAVAWCLSACGNEDAATRAPAEEGYANQQLEHKEITENPSKVLTPEEGRKETVAGQLENERQKEEMTERAEEEMHH